MALSGNDWNRIGIAVILLLIGLGLILFFLKVDALTVVAIVLLGIGIYMFISSFFKSNEVDRFGTSIAGASVGLSFFFLALGGAFLIYSLSKNWIIAVAVFIIVMAVWLVLSIFVDKKRD